MGVRSLQEHRKCGDCVLRTGRPDSSSWRVGMEIQWIIKSTALLVFESHQWREKMTCRNVSVCHCVECQGGDHTVPKWVSSFPSLSSHSGPSPYYHCFLDYCSWFELFSLEPTVPWTIFPLEGRWSFFGLTRMLPCSGTFSGSLLPSAWYSSSSWSDLTFLSSFVSYSSSSDI